ncbi:uncharacterized protein LOC121396576 isoform X1 [Xenopus laevis]|uniref:Uncharacterized protein LOC121396576 isoform X1 n=2 Tax=Xenopus laevis TaxID=8355 RepID=A0A8J1LDS8_XENLA|nr:uncharacterized protein LOC121396576 isoform X1 [Xenopus laevis]
MEQAADMTDTQIPANAASGPPDPFSLPESLNFSIAIIGPQGSGKSTLARALSHQTEQFSNGFLESYFKGEEGSHEVSKYPYPPLPNVTLLDYPGYKATDSLASYLDGIKLDTVQYLLVTVGGAVSDTDLQLLGTLKQKGKQHCMVQTHTDLLLHTEKRRQGKSYWRGQTLQGMRSRVEEHLGGAGLQGCRAFLLSALEPQSFDFPAMMDYMEGEILRWPRSVENNIENQCQELVSVFAMPCDQEGLVEFPPYLSILLDIPPPVPAIVGVAGSNKETIVHGLSDPPMSGLLIKALPGPSSPPLPVDQYLQNLQLESCDVYLIVESGLDNSFRATLVEALVAAGKHCMLIGGDGNHIGGGKEPGHDDEEKRAYQGATDLRGLKVALEKGASQLIRERLLHCLPSIVAQLVRREQRRIMMGVHNLCLDVCTKAFYGQIPQALSSLSAALSSFRSRFGLDEDSISRIAQVTGCSAEDLHSEIHCPLTVPQSTEQLQQMVSQPLSLSELVWSYIPVWGGTETAPIFSPERTYRLLVESVFGMAQDAERVLLRGCTKQKGTKESAVTCRWPCI